MRSLRILVLLLLPLLMLQSLTQAQLSPVPLYGVFNADGSVTLKVMQNGVVVTGTIPPGGVMLTFPPLTLSNTIAITTSELGDAEAIVFGVVPGATLALTDTTGELSLRGQIVQDKVGALSTTADTVTITESAVGYTTRAFTFVMNKGAPPPGPVFNISDYIGTATPFLNDPFTTLPDRNTPSHATTTGYYSTLDFNTHSDVDPGTALYRNYYSTVTRQEGGEAQIYTDPGIPTARPIEPLAVIPGGMLDIQVRPKDAITATMPGFTTPDILYTGGLLRYSNPSQMVHFCIKFRFTAADGVNGNFTEGWLYPPHYYDTSGAEDDPIELDFLFPFLKYISSNKHGASFNGSPGVNGSQKTLLTTGPGTPSGAFHTVVACHTPTYLVVATDQRLSTAMPVPADWVNKPFDAHLDGAARDFTNPAQGLNPLASFDSYWDGWKAWAATDPTTAPTHGVPHYAAYGQINSAITASTTIYYQADQSMEPATQIVSGWRPTGSGATYTFGTPQAIAASGTIVVSGYPTTGAPMDFAIAQVGVGGQGFPYEFLNNIVPALGLQSVTGMAADSPSVGNIHFAFGPVAGGPVPDHYVFTMGDSTHVAGLYGPGATAVPVSYTFSPYGVQSGHTYLVDGFACTAAQTTTGASSAAAVDADIAANCGPPVGISVTVR